MDKFGIKPGPVIRRALEEEVLKHVLRDVERDVKGLGVKLSHISDEEIAKLIREDREGR